MLPQATLDLYDATRRRSVATTLGVRRLWDRIDPDADWAAQWALMLPSAVALVGSAQVGAATDGAASVAVSLRQSGFPERRLAGVAPRAFSGWLEDVDTGAATRLDKALYAPVIRAREAAGSPAEMLLVGRGALESIARTAVSDAGRNGTGVQAVATERTMAVWYEPPPFCQRCAVLIGKRVRPTTQFKRHPRCDGAVRIMSERDHSELADVTPDQVTDLTDAQRKAIEDGADMGQVINVKRGGALRRGGTTTTAGAKRGQARLTPRGIYDITGDDRDAAIELLRQHGYLR